MLDTPRNPGIIEQQIEILPQTRAFLAGRHRNLIGGEWVDGGSGERIDVLDPGTGQCIASVAAADAGDVDKAVKAARAAFDRGPWPRMAPAERARLLFRLADLIDGDLDMLAQLESLDNGAPLSLSRNFFIGGAAECLRYMAGWVTKLTGETVPVSLPGDWHAYTLRQPVGVVGAVVPWNVPLLNAMTKVAPALSAGCTVVLKPAELTPLTALRLGELAEQAGLPPGVLNIVVGDGPVAGAALANHPLVDKISFTGSTETGRLIAQAATGNLKKVSLELGGKSPAIVFADADLDLAIPGVADAIFMNSGQVCVAGSRLFVHRSIYDKVVAGVSERASAIRVGHAFGDSVEMGPLVSQAQHARVSGYIDAGVAAGAELVTGGARSADEGGFFVRPTVLTNTSPDMTVVREEIFGPVVCAIPFDDEEDLTGIITQANDTIYGLAASVWTQNLRTAHLMAESIQAGTVWINSHGALDFALPFGGYKQSGWGREYGKDGLLNYTEVKTVAASL